LKITKKINEIKSFIISNEKCTYGLSVELRGKKIGEIGCPGKWDCLSKEVWSRVGIDNVAARILGMNSDSVQAFVEGNCSLRRRL